MSDEKLRTTFSNNLKRWLDKNDKTQADMCRFMGVSSATASDWCNGKKIPRTDKLGALCAWLEIELDDLLAEPTATVWEYPEGHLHIRQFGFTQDEIKIIYAFRDADELTKQMVLRVLNIEAIQKDQSAG